MQIAIPAPEQRDRLRIPKPLLHWILCWIVLPNIGFWLLWIVGGPPRGKDIFLIGIIGIITHRASFAVRYGAFVLCMVMSILAFICSLFNLSVTSLLYSLELATELKFSASIEYVVSAAAVAATLVGGWFMLRRPAVLNRPIYLFVALGLVWTASWVDNRMSFGNRGSYKRIAPAGAYFTSATQSSGFEKFATGERHAMMIVVEAMGLPTDPRVRNLLTDIWARPEVRSQYEVTTGDTLFYGSTTGGEMRELCGRWGDYFEVLERKDSTCLPTRLASKGYHSQGWHSFLGTFFERQTWYPNIGFRETRFGDQMMAKGAASCTGVFAGACDRDVPGQLASTLKNAKQPQFLYWLTVNSHLPVVRDKSLGTEECASFDRKLDEEFPMTCRLLSLFDQSGKSLAREITAENFPATDILIVGDHIPPFFDRHHRQEFAPDRVPWILLRRKAEAPAAAPKLM